MTFPLLRIATVALFIACTAACSKSGKQTARPTAEVESMPAVVAPKPSGWSQHAQAPELTPEELLKLKETLNK